MELRCLLIHGVIFHALGFKGLDTLYSSIQAVSLKPRSSTKAVTRDTWRERDHNCQLALASSVNAGKRFCRLGRVSWRNVHTSVGVADGSDSNVLTDAGPQGGWAIEACWRDCPLMDLECLPQREQPPCVP